MLSYSEMLYLRVTSPLGIKSDMDVKFTNANGQVCCTIINSKRAVVYFRTRYNKKQDKEKLAQIVLKELEPLPSLEFWLDYCDDCGVEPYPPPFLTTEDKKNILDTMNEELMLIKIERTHHLSQ